MAPKTNGAPANGASHASASASALSASETPRGGATASAGSDPAAKHKKVRISAFDAMRFLLIAYIASGHFIAFAGPSLTVQKAFSQVNVAVGAFFALSGYVAAYTSTENAERAASSKLLDTPKPKWILSKIFGYFPLHAFVLLLFSPVLAYPDLHFNGWPTAIWHGFLSLTMTQAWFPLHAEVWNAPTWFLSALTFATTILPFGLPYIAKMTKPQLRRTAGYLFLAGLLPKIGYCYDHNAWKLFEGTLSPKANPSFNLAAFNVQRFNPFYATIEVLLGAVACRLVMLDGAQDEDDAPSTNVLSTLFPFAGMVAVTILRAMGTLELSDVLTRALIFIPLFLKFLMAAHRASVLPKVQDPLVKILSSKPLVALGNLAFPIFVVHGPLGQLFYKKITASQVFGGPLHKVVGPEFFYAFLGIVLASAYILQKTFLASKTVAGWSKSAIGKLSDMI